MGPGPPGAARQRPGLTLRRLVSCRRTGAAPPSWRAWASASGRGSSRGESRPGPGSRCSFPGLSPPGKAHLPGQSVGLWLDGRCLPLTISCSGVSSCGISFLWGPVFAYHGTVLECVVFLVLPVTKTESGYMITFNTYNCL